VKEYWLVSPELAMIEIFTLDNGSFRLHDGFMQQERLQSSIFPELAFAMAEAFVTGTSEPVFLTEKAGTGKTTFLKRIGSIRGKATAVAAPTGVAAINAGGVTLHSLFQLPLGPHVPGFRQQERERTKMREA
jgi:hypothetical protein